MLRRWRSRRAMRWAVRWWAGLESVDRAFLLDSRRKAQMLHMLAYHRRDVEAYRMFLEARTADASP